VGGGEGQYLVANREIWGFPGGQWL